MVSCALRSCYNRDGRDNKKSSGITFHSFPKDPVRRAAWVSFVNRRNWQPSKHSKLCSEHFEAKCFDRTSLCVVRLQLDAIPTLKGSHTMDWNHLPMAHKQEFHGSGETGSTACHDLNSVDNSLDHPDYVRIKSECEDGDESVLSTNPNEETVKINNEDIKLETCSYTGNFEYCDSTQLSGEFNIKNELDLTSDQVLDRTENEPGAVLNWHQYYLRVDEGREALPIKTEPCESEMFKGHIDMSTTLMNEELDIKNDTGTNANETLALGRIRSEHCSDMDSMVKNENLASDMCTGKEDFEYVDSVQLSEELLDTKSEKLDTKTEPETSTYIPLKSAVKNTIRRKHQAVRSEAGEGLFICYYCEYAVHTKHRLITHMKAHMMNTRNSLYSCNSCDFQTFLRRSLIAHMRTHPSNSCGTYKKEENLDDSVAREYISVLHKHHIIRKIHECTKCTFKTTVPNKLNKHLLKHAKTAALYKLSICIHCKAPFKSKMALDYHVIKKHPSFISSVTTKIYECTKCTFKTTVCTHLMTHLLTHAKTSIKC